MDINSCASFQDFFHLCSVPFGSCAIPNNVLDMPVEHTAPACWRVNPEQFICLKGQQEKFRWSAGSCPARSEFHFRKQPLCFEAVPELVSFPDTHS
jgi:hypothetical protein